MAIQINILDLIVFNDIEFLKQQLTLTFPVHFHIYFIFGDILKFHLI